MDVMFDDDQHLKNLESKCRECLNAAFNAAQQYADTFQPFRVFYKENEGTDVERIKTDEHGSFKIKHLNYKIIKLILFHLIFKTLNSLQYLSKSTTKRKRCPRI